MSLCISKPVGKWVGELVKGWESESVSEKKELISELVGEWMSVWVRKWVCEWANGKGMSD